MRFTAEVLADNRPMLAVFSRAGWPVERRFESGVVDLDFSLDETEEFLDSVERREQRADSRAVARLLLPRTIAVVGASDDAGLDRSRPVAPRHRGRHGRRCSRSTRATTPSAARRPFARLQDVPADVNLAVVAVPAAALPARRSRTASRRASAARSSSRPSRAPTSTSAPLVDRARSYGVRLIGPAAWASPSPRESVGVAGRCSCRPTCRPGNVAISLQSGSLGASVLRLADDLRMGLSWFVSLGDKSDVSGNDLLQFWEDDETTRVIAMYTESFGNPRKFARIARRVSRHRPIVAVRTGAAAIGSDGGALYQQAGLIEVPTVRGDARHGPGARRPSRYAGPRVAVLSNARSPATLGDGGPAHGRPGGRRPPVAARLALDARRLRARPCAPRSPTTTSTP